MNKLLLIAFGGAFGSVARYLMVGWTHKAFDTTFPLGTLAVNVIGCMCIGVLGALFDRPHLVAEELRVGLLIGVLGGFTTFSSFGLETFRLVNDGEYLRAILNVLVTNASCLLVAWAGYRITERIVGA